MKNSRSLIAYGSIIDLPDAGDPANPEGVKVRVFVVAAAALDSCDIGAQWLYEQRTTLQIASLGDKALNLPNIFA